MKLLRFSSRIEAAFVRLMGGVAVNVPVLNRAIILSLGPALRQHHFKHRVHVDGRDFVAFGNDIKWGIELDGLRYGIDKSMRAERDRFFEFYGWRVMHIPSTKVVHSPARVRADVLAFLAD
jgi:very-short-patch-repair endonuclease